MLEHNTQPERLDWSTERHVRQVKSVVEIALRRKFGKDPKSKVTEFAGKLSTNPRHIAPDINNDSLKDKCNSFSEELTKCLLKLGLPIENSKRDPHEFLFVRRRRFFKSDVVVVIDPSIGQFIEGYNHVFVGTISQLHHLVVEQTKQGGKYTLLQNPNQYSSEYFFRKYWGHSLPPPPENSKERKQRKEYIRRRIITANLPGSN